MVAILDNWPQIPNRDVNSYQIIVRSLLSNPCVIHYYGTCNLCILLKESCKYKMHILHIILTKGTKHCLHSLGTELLS